jgi:hypothetical protein
MDEAERLRYLPKLKDIPPGVKESIEKPFPGSRRLRCMVDGVEVDPTGMFDVRGRTNYEKLTGDAGGKRKQLSGGISYTDVEDIA